MQSPIPTGHSYLMALLSACTCVLSHVQLFSAPWTVACQTPLSMEFSRQEYWRGLPFPTPEDLPDPEIEPTSPESPALQVDSLLSEPPGKPILGKGWRFSGIGPLRTPWSFDSVLELLLEKEMATHSRILAWRISWPEEPGRLQSVWS